MAIDLMIILTMIRTVMIYNENRIMGKIKGEVMMIIKLIFTPTGNNV